MPIPRKEEEECIQLLKRSVLFRKCSDDELRALAKTMEKRVYKRGDVLIKEGEPQTKLFVIAQGKIVREKNIEGQIHHIDTQMGGSTVGSLHVLQRDPVYATSNCQAKTCETYELLSKDLDKHFQSNSNFAKNVAVSLSEEIRRYTKALRTPLFEQHSKKTNWQAVSLAASIESFYRAALNAILNQQLTGVKRGSLFPNMHIQIPTRVLYINGLKGIRSYLDHTVKPEDYNSPGLVRMGVAIAPGVCMTPISSVLEASNAGHANPEPLYRRWMRGLVPRALREVIFGIGLNQLSDYCEERVPYFESPTVRNALGSLTAGVVSGYLSHVVHNLSTLKLMDPNKSYSELFHNYTKKAEARFPETMSPSLRRFCGITSSLLFPVGVHIRTGQIIGSFVILNGTINAVQRFISPNGF